MRQQHSVTYLFPASLLCYDCWLMSYSSVAGNFIFGLSLWILHEETSCSSEVALGRQLYRISMWTRRTWSIRTASDRTAPDTQKQYVAIHVRDAISMFLSGLYFRFYTSSSSFSSTCISWWWLVRSLCHPWKSAISTPTGRRWWVPLIVTDP